MIGKVLGTFNIFISPINNMAFPGNSDKFKTLNRLFSGSKLFYPR